MVRIVLILIGCLLPNLFLLSQSVDMAEIKPDGIVVPVVDHTSVVNPDEGQLAFNPMSNSYWYYDGGQWFELSPNSIHDTDEDTSVSVDDGGDNDEIIFTIAGKEYGRIMKNTNDIHVFSLYNDAIQRGNVVFGINSGLNLDTNGFCCNSLFGEEAGRELTSGDTNVMMGTGAGRNSTIGSGNTFIGTDSGEANIDGYGNVALGKSAGFANQNSSHNVAVGLEAGFNNVASDNTFIGGFSGRETTTGYGNTFVGTYAGQTNDVGEENTMVGGRAGQNSQGYSNSMLGYAAGQNANSNSSLLAGTYAGHNNTGNASTILGIGAGFVNQGESAILIGAGAGNDNRGDFNIIIGEQAGINNKGGSSIIIGWNAAQENTEDDLMAIGEDSGLNNQGTSNTFVGKRTGTENTIGSNNTYIGFSAGQNNPTGSSNVMVGDSTGYVTTGGSNSFVGSRSGISVTTGSQNSFLGRATGEYSTSGSYNTFLGEWAGRWNGTGDENTYVGKSSGLANFDGNANVFLGRGVGAFSQYTVDSSIVIGYFAGDGFMASNRLVIENSNDAQPLIYGEFDNQSLGVNWDSSTPVPNTLSVNGEASKSTAGSWIGNSDARLKRDIQYLSSEKMLEKVLEMKAVSFNWDDKVTGFDRPTGKQYGFIAQDIQKVWPANVSEDEQGYLQTAYGTYDHLYVESIKELANENERLRKEIEYLKDTFSKELASLKSLILEEDQREDHVAEN